MPKCSCCNATNLSARQITRHKKIYLHRLAGHLDAQDQAEAAAAVAAEAEAEDEDEDEGDVNVDVEMEVEDGVGDNGAGAVYEEEDAMEVEQPAAHGAPDNLGDTESVNGFGDMSEVDNGDELFVLPADMPRGPELRQNPPVRIADWTSDDEAEVGSDSGTDDASIHSADRDPEFVERPEPLGLDPDDEAGMNEEELWNVLHQNHGDLADDEWIDMYDRNITDNDRTVLQLLATRLRTHFSRQTYKDLRHGACESLEIPSEFIAWRRLRILSGLETSVYDCCIESCICYLGKYKDLESCPYCKQPRYNQAGKARRQFRYSPLIPQLHGLFQTPESIKKMRYRADVGGTHEPGKFLDIFDGEHYRTLRNTKVRPDAEYKFFDHPDDIALGLATDGFTLFKRRRRGRSTAWPLILINYNLHPKIRNRLENVICVGVIPGPKQCKDLNSFLIPLIEELLELLDGVKSSKVASEVDDLDDEGAQFVLRAFIILLFGDIPAVAKLLAMKGHNSRTPCRACVIQGVLCRLPRNSVYYVPLTCPGEAVPGLPLLMRTHAMFLADYADLQAARRRGERDRAAQECGINSRSVFARLPSIDLSCAAPYDIMHLFFENLIPNMLKHWKGKFKWLDQGAGNYELSKAQWADIGRQTEVAARTVPSAFSGTLPNIDEDENLYKAEAYSFWFTYVAPIVLKDRLPNPYYDHFILIREVILWCLEFEITSDQIDALERMVVNWVQEYERLYYQYEENRLPTCPLTIHALLHIPYYIRRTGPLWASWAFVMERFCGHLLVPGLKNRVRPYEYLDSYIQRRAQMQIVSRVLDMPSLARPRVNYRYQAGEKLSSTEFMYDKFPNVVLGTPIRKIARLPDQITNQFTKYFGVVYRQLRLRAPQLRLRIDWGTLVRYGRFQLVGDGDSVRVADIIQRDPTARDNSFVRYDLLPDTNARFVNLPDRPVRVTHYGQVLDIYYVEFIKDLEADTRDSYLLARVRECNTNGLDASLPNNPLVTYNRLSTPDIIHLETVNAVVGRIAIRDRVWAIIDRSRNGARTQFVDEDDGDDD